MINAALLALTLLAPPPAPQVTLTSPVGGYSTDRICKVQGNSKNGKSAMLIVNGSERPLNLTNDGHFEAVFMATPGRNFVEVQVRGKDGKVAKAQTNFHAIVPNLDLVVMLYWDTNGTDVDLHVVEPNEEECYYGHRETASGGNLDVDDTDGYGPEVYTLASAPAGKYNVFVQYYSDNGHPQSLAVVDVILHPGTANESRQTFEKMLTHTGDKVDIGTFTITENGKLVISD